MKKLRLLITEKCNNSCIKCQNKHWDLKQLPVVNVKNLNILGEFDEIILTGGEPMFEYEKLKGISVFVKSRWPNIKLFLYTASLITPRRTIDVMEYLDGLTVTLHTENDLRDLLMFRYWILNNKQALKKSKTMSMRVCTFNNHPDITKFRHLFYSWTVKTDKVWITEKHLPKDETYMRLTYPD